MAGELSFDLFLQPLSALMVLTGGAVAIAAGAIDAMDLTALLALIEGDPTCFGAAGDEGINDLTVGIGHGLGETFQILGAKGSEDLIEGGHGPSPPLPD